MLFPPRKGQPNDELTWAWLNKIRDWCRRNEVYLGNDSGLELKKLDCGTFLRATPSTQGVGQLAVTVSSISACVYNTTPCINVGTLLKWDPGTGSVYTVDYDGTCFVADTSSDPVDVFNFSTTTGGIAANVLVWIEQDSQGNWIITAVDCAN